MYFLNECQLFIFFKIIQYLKRLFRYLGERKKDVNIYARHKARHFAYSNPINYSKRLRSQFYSHFAIERAEAPGMNKLSRNIFKESYSQDSYYSLLWLNTYAPSVTVQHFIHQLQNITVSTLYTYFGQKFILNKKMLFF